MRFDSIVRVGSCMEAPCVLENRAWDTLLFFFLCLLFRSIIRQIYSNTEDRSIRKSFYNFVIKNWLLEIYCFLESKRKKKFTCKIHHERKGIYIYFHFEKQEIYFLLAIQDQLSSLQRETWWNAFERYIRKNVLWKERHCANGWRCFDFVERVGNGRSKSASPDTWMRWMPARIHLSESSLADTIFSTRERREQPLIGASILHESIRARRLRKKYISPDYAEMDEGSPCFRRVNPLVSLQKRRPINSKWTPIKRDDQKFNGTEMLARVTRRIPFGWIFFIDDSLFNIYICIRSVHCTAPFLLPLSDPNISFRLSQIIIIIISITHSTFSFFLAGVILIELIKRVFITHTWY